MAVVHVTVEKGKAWMRGQITNESDVPVSVHGTPAVFVWGSSGPPVNLIGDFATPPQPGGHGNQFADLKPGRSVAFSSVREPLRDYARADGFRWNPIASVPDAFIRICGSRTLPTYGYIE